MTCQTQVELGKVSFWHFGFFHPARGVSRFCGLYSVERRHKHPNTILKRFAAGCYHGLKTTEIACYAKQRMNHFQP
jgi:hypothetical protein